MRARWPIARMAHRATTHGRPSNFIDGSGSSVPTLHKYDAVARGYKIGRRSASTTAPRCRTPCGTLAHLDTHAPATFHASLPQHEGKSNELGNEQQVCHGVLAAAQRHPAAASKDAQLSTAAPRQCMHRTTHGVCSKAACAHAAFVMKAACARQPEPNEQRDGAACRTRARARESVPCVPACPRVQQPIAFFVLDELQTIAFFLCLMTVALHLTCGA